MDELEPPCRLVSDYIKDLYSDKYSKKYIIHIEKYENKNKEKEKEKENNVNKNEEKENYIDNKKKFECYSNNLKKVDKIKEQNGKKVQIRSESPVGNLSTGLTLTNKIIFTTNNNTQDISPTLKFTLVNDEPKNEILNKKRKNKPLEKGRVKNTMINVYKSNFFSAVQEISSDLLKKTEYYKQNKKNLNKINNQIYIVQSAQKNLLLIEKQLKDILSDRDENNKKIIDEIFENNDNDNNISTLKTFLNEYTKDLMFYFSYNNLIDTKCEYKSKLKIKYDTLIGKLKKNKTDIYIKRFEDYIKNIKKTFEDMKEKGDKMKLKRIKNKKV